MDLAGSLFVSSLQVQTIAGISDTFPKGYF